VADRVAETALIVPVRLPWVVGERLSPEVEAGLAAPADVLAAGIRRLA
jgi:hypothetical protein